MNENLVRPAYTYIVECSDGTFYTGWTYDVNNRLETHNKGQGAKYTRGRRPVRLVYVEKHPNKSVALHCEVLLKQLTRKQKLSLIAKLKDQGGFDCDIRSFES